MGRNGPESLIWQRSRPVDTVPTAADRRRHSADSRIARSRRPGAEIELGIEPPLGVLAVEIGRSCQWLRLASGSSEWSPTLREMERAS